MVGNDSKKKYVRTIRIGKENDESCRRAVEWKIDVREAGFKMSACGSRAVEIIMNKNGGGGKGSASV